MVIQENKFIKQELLSRVFPIGSKIAMDYENQLNATYVDATEYSTTSGTVFDEQLLVTITGQDLIDIGILEGSTISIDAEFKQTGDTQPDFRIAYYDGSTESNILDSYSTAAVGTYEQIPTEKFEIASWISTDEFRFYGLTGNPSGETAFIRNINIKGVINTFQVSQYYRFCMNQVLDEPDSTLDGDTLVPLSSTGDYVATFIRIR